MLIRKLKIYEKSSNSGGVHRFAFGGLGSLIGGDPQEVGRIRRGMGGRNRGEKNKKVLALFKHVF